MPGPVPVTSVGTDEFRPGGWNARYVGVILILVLTGELAFITSAIPLNALPEIANHFQTTQASWIPTSFFLVAALVSPIAGTLADRFGKKRFLLVILFVSFFGLLLSAFAPNFALLMLGRVLHAPILTFPFLLPSLVRDIFPTRTLSLAIALAVTGAGVIGIPTQLLSGPMLEAWGWRSAFWMPAILVVILVLLLMAFVPETTVRHTGGRVDVVGALLLGVGVTLVLVGVSFGPSWGWQSPGVLGSIGGGILLLIAWVLQAKRVAAPLVDLRQLASRPFAITLVVVSAFVSMSSWFLVFMPVLVLTPAPDGPGLDPTQQSQLAALFALSGSLAGFGVGIALRRRASGTVAIALGVIQAIGYAIAYLGQTSHAAIAVATFFIGLGGAGAGTVGYNILARIVEPRNQAVSASTLSLSCNMAASIVSVAFFAIMNALGTADPGSGVVAYGRASFSAATLIPIGVCLAGIIAAAVLRSTPAAGGLLSETHEPSTQLAYQGGTHD